LACTTGRGGALTLQCRCRYTSDHFTTTPCKQFSREFFEEIAAAMGEARVEDDFD
jgi:hypothetical protein